ncbi:phosphotransferase family protein [Mariniluteicoccus flavus]
MNPGSGARRDAGIEGPRGAREVRAEDAFDVGALAEWLRSHADAGLSPALEGIPEVRQFSGGASNLTYLLRYPSGTDLILRRPPAGAASGHDMAREYVVQSRLRPAYALVPATVALCEDPDVIGRPFYVMERVAGFIPRKEFPPEVPQDRESVATLCRRVVDLLVELHGVDIEAAGLGEFHRGDGYVARQVAGWSARYRAARTPNVPTFSKVIAWLEANQPPDRGAVLIHNDFRFDNIVLDAEDPTTPIALLDWEMATIGDPLMDLGGALAYWVEAGDGFVFRQFRRQPTHVAGMMTRAEVVEHYCAQTGIALTHEEWAFYEVFGLFRLAGICQQIYHRFYHRKTTNPAFRGLGFAVWMLELRCRRIMRRAG